MEKQRIIETLNQAYFSEQPHEMLVLREMPKLLKGVRVFADIGASLGQFTKAACESLSGATIVAVEADPVRFEELELNAKKWSQATGNQVNAIHAAATAEDGPVHFHVTQSSVSGGLFRHELNHLDAAAQSEVHWREISVAGRTLDSLFPDTPPDFVKMDIEGAELMAFRGAERILKAGRTTFLVELHDFTGPNGEAIPEAVRSILSRHGYHG
jgi:FkbM family methyltransferase